jgi:hypothetical protein
MKRQRGGQQGNRNACKHGLYSSQLSPDEMELYNNAVNHDHIDPPVAFLRIKLLNILRQDLDNRRALDEISRSLTDWYTDKFRLDGDSRRIFKKQVDDIVDNLVQIYHEGSPQVPENEKKPSETNYACFSNQVDQLTHKK